MKIACHYPIPRPPAPSLDAAVQDGMKLVAAVGGEINFLYPGKKARKVIPRLLCGFHQLPYLWRLDARVDLHHIFSNGLYPYPILRFFRKPVLFTSVIAVGNHLPALGKGILRKVNRFVVGSEREQEAMTKLGLKNCEVIPPGIDITAFSHSFFPCDNQLVVLHGSAPWNEDQFRSKGVDALLEAAAALPWLHLVFLWREKLLPSMLARVESHSLSERVRVIDRHVEVDKELQRVHAAVVLADQPRLIKGFPHSLLEALAAGKPVLVSNCLDMADYVGKNQCGVCVPDLQHTSLVQCLQKLRNCYSRYAEAAEQVDMRCFSADAMIASYTELYRCILTGRSRGG